MKPFKHIKNAKYYIGEIANNIKTATSDKQKAFYTKMAETFIAIVNDNQTLLTKHLKSDVMDSLILARMYDQLQDQERKSMNYNQNLYVVERKAGNKLEYVGTIDIDMFVEVNHKLECKPDGAIARIEIKSKHGNSFGKLDEVSSVELSEAFYGQKVNGIFIDEIVKSIDEDIKYNQGYNLERVVSFLTTKETELAVQKNINDLEKAATSLASTKTKTIEVLVIDLVEQFKNNMQWIH